MEIIVQDAFIEKIDTKQPLSQMIPMELADRSAAAALSFGTGIRHSSTDIEWALVIA